MEQKTPTTPTPTLKEIRDVIPKHCFESSLPRSLSYVLRDFIYAAIVLYCASYIPSIEHGGLRFLAWMVYGFSMGAVLTGLWILAHECGHGGFSKYGRVNDTIGWALHSLVGVPYFSWKITHARHHRYTGNMDKDTAFVPYTEEEYAFSRKTTVAKLAELGEDTPFVTMLNLLGHQLGGWQAYMLFYVSGGNHSTINEKGSYSHFDPFGRLWTKEQKLQIAISDLGLFLVASMLYFVGTKVGFANVFFLYGVPYLWVNHWLVAITYLHHTHPSIPHYSASEWTFTKGALGTIDRSVGFLGQHFFHEIIDFHVIHHLFPRIPFYKAEEATRAVQPLLGSHYHEAKKESFTKSLWTTFRRCQYVVGTGRLEWND